MENSPTYGYGVKGFVLSMIEMALELSNYTVSNKIIEKILDIGKDMINKPVELLEGAETTLKQLSGHYKLVLVAKGDLLDQERKLEKSGLLGYFHHIEVLNEKEEANYSKLLVYLDIKPAEFLMIGNSLKSDILPVINSGSSAIHVPFHTTWQHVVVDEKHLKNKNYLTLNAVHDIVKYLHK